MTSVRKRTWLIPAKNGKPARERQAWVVDYKDNQGVRRSAQFPLKSQATDYEKRIGGEIIDGVHVPASVSITFKDAGDRWLRTCKANELERTTTAGYEQHLRLHILPHLGETKLRDLTKPTIEAFRDALQTRVSRAMAKKVMTTLKAVMSDAERLGHIVRNPARGVAVKTKKRKGGDRPKRVRIPNKGEMVALLEASISSPVAWHAPFIHLLVFTALRVSEARGLSWADVDLKDKSVTVARRADRFNIVSEPKSNAGFRSIPLAPATVKLLTKWKLRCPKSPQDLVFPSEAGTPMFHANIVERCLLPLMTAAGLIDNYVYSRGKRKGQIKRGNDGQPLMKWRYTLHELRHFAASLWIQQNLDLKRIQVWMGHHSVAYTIDIYGHLIERARNDAAIVAGVEQALFADAKRDRAVSV